MDFDWKFWLALILAAIVKAVMSPFHSILSTVTMMGVSLFIGWAFWQPVIDLLHLNPEIYQVPVAILLALTAEQLVRFLMDKGVSELVARLTGNRKGGGKS